MSCIEQLSLYQDKAQIESPNDIFKPEVSQLNEIRLSGNRHVARSLLAGMLLELSAAPEQRWLCWVAEMPLRPLLDAGTSLRGQRILQVVSGESSLCQIAARALERGKSHTVALLMERELSLAERHSLEAAARQGGAECLVIYMQ